MNTDSLLYLIISAEDADYHSMAIGTLLRPDAMKDTNFKRLINVGNGMVGEIVAQDQHIDALLHKGLKSKFAPRGRYSRQKVRSANSICGSLTAIARAGNYTKPHTRGTAVWTKRHLWIKATGSGAAFLW